MAQARVQDIALRTGRVRLAIPTKAGIHGDLPHAGTAWPQPLGPAFAGMAGEAYAGRPQHPTQEIHHATFVWLAVRPRVDPRRHARFRGRRASWTAGRPSRTRIQVAGPKRRLAHAEPVPRQVAGAVFLSEGFHARLHRRGLSVSRRRDETAQ